MDIAQIREYALALPGATEDMPFGPDALTIRVGGRIFCMLDLSGTSLFYNLKANPEYAAELCERYLSVNPGYHMNKRHWISVDLSGDVPYQLHRQLIEHSYQCVFKSLPLKVRNQFLSNDKVLNS